MKFNAALFVAALFSHLTFAAQPAAAQSAAEQPAADLPAILSDSKLRQTVYLPDFSYAGYANGEAQPDTRGYQIIEVENFGVLANDGKDDTVALLTLLESLADKTTPTVLQFAAGRYILSDIIRIQRSHLVFRGVGSGLGGTQLYFPRPLIYAQEPAELKELREYLVALNKIQTEKVNNIRLPFTQWSWSGGFLWTGVKGQRVKQYLDSYNSEEKPLAVAVAGQQGLFDVTLADTQANALKVGEVIELRWFNPEGEKGSFLQELYPGDKLKVGSHHWMQPQLALERQQVRIVALNGNTMTIKAPLLHNIRSQWQVGAYAWQHLTAVGFEHFAIEFPFAEPIAHHVEQGFNGLYLTRLFDSWVQDITINNADNGILTEEIANVSIDKVHTTGSKLAHYSVQMGGVHNVLVRGLTVDNVVRHPLSFNTFSTRSVYSDVSILQAPVLDQHSGVNQQNLFDHIKLNITLSDPTQRTYPLFAGGGAGYWKPSHASYNSFWNIQVHFTNGHDSTQAILLNGMSDGANARLMGISGDLPITVEYGPDAYMEGINHYYQQAPSLYRYQLAKRLRSN
ncbi:MAG: hypothetical protein GW763_14760 [Paraglaciecola sp.]|nr:hypothetical protein [Paraglaciecola sp.]NCT49212.1 hypothetical protein [Paraglaciecola sp.]